MNRWKPLASVALVAALVAAPMASMGAYADELAPPDESVQVVEEPQAPVEEVAPPEEPAPPEEAVTPEVAAPEETAAPEEQPAAPDEPVAPVETEAAAPEEDAAVEVAPLMSAEANAEEPQATLVGVIGILMPWTPATNQASYWENLYSDHNATCYENQFGSISNDNKTVTLPAFNPDLDGDHWELLVIKGGSDWINVIHHPTPGVAYASPATSSGQQSEVSHYIVCIGDHPDVLPATASVQVTPPSCVDRNGSLLLSYAHATVTSVTRNGGAVPVAGFPSGTIAAPDAGTYVIVLTADPGYSFDGAATKTLMFTVPPWLTDQDCAATATVVVTPPSCVDLNGSVLLTYTHATVTSATRNGGAVPVAGFPSGTIAAPDAGTYVIVLTADAGYTFDGAATKTLTFTVPPWLTAQDCAATATVVVTPPSCVDLNGSVLLTYTHATVTSATLNGTGVPVAGFPSGTMAAPAAGNYVLVLTAEAGYTFDGGAATKTLTFTVPPWLTAQDCTATATVVVTPPSCVDRNGSVLLTYTHATVTSATRDGVSLPVAGFPSGTIGAPVAGTYVLVLTADAGYSFGGAATQTLTFTVPPWLTAQDCAATATVVVTPPSCVDLNGSVLLTYAHATVTSATLNGVGVPVAGFPSGTMAAPVAGTYVLVLTADAGYMFGDAATQTLTFTVPPWLTEDDCEVPIPALFNAAPTPPTCVSPGAAPTFTDNFPNVDFELEGPVGGGPGEYMLTVIPVEGFVIEEENLPAGWVLNPDGTATRTFTVLGAIGFQDDDPEAECYVDLQPGDIESRCVGAIPYLAYEVILPEGYEPESDTPVTITFVHPTDPAMNYTVENLPLAGTALWPGASAGPPPQWPGWVQLANGTYVETDGNFAWTRAAGGITVVFEVNPTFTTTVTYPPESSICANPPAAPRPASVPGTRTGTSALPATGGSDMTPWGITAALMLTAGVMLVTMRRPARR